MLYFNFNVNNYSAYNNYPQNISSLVRVGSNFTRSLHAWVYDLEWSYKTKGQGQKNCLKCPLPNMGGEGPFEMATIKPCLDQMCDDCQIRD